VKKFDYLSTENKNPLTTGELDTYGENGWELVAVTVFEAQHGGTWLNYTFKRELDPLQVTVMDRNAEREK
jgi:hypothetical protein